MHMRSNLSSEQIVLWQREYGVFGGKGMALCGRIAVEVALRLQEEL